MRLLIEQLLISLCLWCTAQSANNLEIKGNQVYGESFRLECSTNLTKTQNYATFYRSTNSGLLGTRVGYREFDPTLTPSCNEGPVHTNYTVRCNSDGSMFTLTISANNAMEHKTYWRCRTDTDYSLVDTNQIMISIIVNITGISWVSPVVGSDNTVNVTSDKPTTFQCQTTQGRPAANITWYIDNVTLSGATTTKTPISGDIVNTTGYLTLTVNRTADDKVISCRATNYINMEEVESTVKPVIKVKYAPSGPPVMDGYYNGTVYHTRVGRSQNVTCEVPTAYPVPTLSWPCPSYTVRGTTPLRGSTDVVSSSITWTATSTEPGQTCQCTSYQEVSGNVITYISIDVLYPPSSLKYQLNVSGVSTDVSGIIYVIKGDTIRLTCNTVSNPTPATDQYNWTRSTGGSWTNGQQELTLTNIDISSDDTYTSEVTNTMTTTDGTTDIGNITSHIAINVLYSPSSPSYKLSGVLTDVSRNIDVIQGDTAGLTCNTVSNPAPAANQYIWSRSTGDTWTHGQQELTMAHINVSDDAVYTCMVTNTMKPTIGRTQTGTNQSEIAVNVLYPPSTPNITYRCKTNPVSISVTKNTSYPVTCQSEGKPVPYVQWTVREQTTGDGTSSLYSIQNSGNYTCTVNNTMIRRPGDPSTVSKRGMIEIVLLYGPEVRLIQNQTIVEGSPLNVTCTADSNPPVSFYNWSRPGSTDIYIEGPVLHIPSVLRSDDGVYTCHAGNVMLLTCEQDSITETGARGTMVVVQYVPDMMGHADRDVVEHQTSTISCTADGVPANYTFYNWSHVAPDNVTVLRSLPGTYNSTTTTLTLFDVNYQDTGYYRCNVSNGVHNYITGETNATTYVMFTVKSFPITESLEADTGKKNGSSTLAVKFYSNDGTVPTVTWRKSSKQTVSNITDIRFESSVNVSNVTLTMYKQYIQDQPGFIGRLTIHNITQEDFTNYSCQIANTIGSTTVFLALQPEGPPDPPRQLRTTVTYSSITLFWLSGFHGGADQTFTVEYRTATETFFKVAAVISVGKNEGVQFNTTIQGLSADTQYVIHINCSNIFGQQEEIRFVEARTAPSVPEKAEKTETLKPSLGPIIGGTVGGLVGIAVVVGVVVGVVLFRRRLPAKTPPNRPIVDRNRANLTVEKGIPMDTKTYENRTFVHAKGVRIHLLYDYIMENIADDAEGLKNEFFKLKNGLTAAHKVADMKQNKEKNRYKNMIAYDDSRVHLKDRDEEQTDYINACHILGYEKVSKFMASQGPTKVMVGDFWQMVWQEDTGKIVMLTNLMELGAVKCIQYWPDAGSVVYGDITVSLKGVKRFPDYTLRSLDIRKGDESPHRVEQFHFQAWPDKNVPDSAWSLVSFWRTVSTCHSRHKGPTVVHCSAGVGRTGTYIALDWLYNQAHVEGVVNVFDCVETLRRQRVNMVQTPTQYAYLHETVAESLCFGTLPLLTSHYREWYAHMLEKIDHPWNKSVNPCSRLEIQHELYLQSIGDYENGACQGLGSAEAATYLLKNYMEKAVFLVVNTVRRDADTTLPRMAADRNIKLIINLSDGVLNIDGNRTTVKTFDVTTWGDNGIPDTMSEVVALIEDVLKVQPRQTEVSPIMLYSNYPVERCGLICILLNEIQRMKIDGQLSILQSAKSLKSMDGRFVVAPNLAQFKFCHDVILEYLNQAEIYQNVPT